MKVWSVSPFFNEQAALEIKLREQAEIVDVFVLAEATHTYAGTPKPVRLRGDGEWAGWLNELAGQLGVEVRVVEVGEPPADLRPWQADAYPHAVDHWRRENHQRASIGRGMSDLEADDIIVLSDLDEIVRPGTIRWYEEQGLTCIMRPPLPMHVAMIDLRWQWAMPVIARVFRGRHLLEGQTCEDVRRSHGMILPAMTGSTGGIRDPMSAYGWHLSYLGGADAIRYKVEQAAHPELMPRLSDRGIEAALSGAGDLFGRGHVLERVGPRGWPTCVVDEPERWADHLTALS